LVLGWCYFFGLGLGCLVLCKVFVIVVLGWCYFFGLGMGLGNPWPC